MVHRQVSGGRLTPGTWVRVIRRRKSGWAPASKWHLVDDHDVGVRLRCPTPTDAIDWAISHPGEYATEQRRRKPDDGVCALCVGAIWTAPVRSAG